MIMKMSASDFQGSFNRLKDKLLQFSDSNGHTCDVEQSIGLQELQIPEYIEIIIKINNKEFDRLRLNSNYPIDDSVNYILHSGQEITKIKQEIINYICYN